MLGKLNTLTTFLVVALSCLVFVGNASTLHAQDVTVQLDPAGTQIEFTLSASFHTVHGSFQLKNGAIHFNPTTGVAGGAVIVDATSAETGNTSRDRKMHAEVLESKQYPEVTFRPTRILGSIPAQGEAEVQVEGIFRLHGADHPMTLTVPLQISGDTVSAQTRFTVPYVAWGLKNPSTFLLHVSDKVQVEVTMKGHMTR